MTEPIYVGMPDMFAASDASVRLHVYEQPTPESRIVPLNHVRYDVEPYYVAYGRPVADTPMGILCSGEVEIGDLSAEGAYPRPWDVLSDARSRWLPLEGTWTPGYGWAAFQGTDRMVLDPDGTDPVLDSAFEHLRGQELANGQALRMDGTDHLLTDAIAWGSESVTVLMVAVLRTPLLDSYGLLETYDADSALPNRPFFGVRYTRDGTVQTHSAGLRDARQSSSQGIRTGQPVIVGIHLEPPSTLTTVLTDRTTTAFTTSLGGAHPYDARLFIGRAPGVAQGNAAMDVLELDYWTDLSREQMLSRVNQLDVLYGVSR